MAARWASGFKLARRIECPPSKTRRDVTLTRRAYARRPLAPGEVFSESLRDCEVKRGFGRPRIFASGPKLLWKLGRQFADNGGVIFSQSSSGGFVMLPANRRKSCALNDSVAHISGSAVRGGALRNKGAHYGSDLVRTGAGAVRGLTSICDAVPQRFCRERRGSAIARSLFVCNLAHGRALGKFRNGRRAQQTRTMAHEIASHSMRRARVCAWSSIASENRAIAISGKNPPICLCRGRPPAGNPFDSPLLVSKINGVGKLRSSPFSGGGRVRYSRRRLARLECLAATFSSAQNLT